MIQQHRDDLRKAEQQIIEAWKATGDALADANTAHLGTTVEEKLEAARKAIGEAQVMAMAERRNYESAMAGQ